MVVTRLPARRGWNDTKHVLIVGWTHCSYRIRLVRHKMLLEMVETLGHAVTMDFFELAHVGVVLSNAKSSLVRGLQDMGMHQHTLGLCRAKADRGDELLVRSILDLGFIYATPC